MTEPFDDILTRLPARLKEARRKKGLSLDAIAKLSGVSRSMVSQIERGESSPTISTLWNLMRALQIDFAGLLDETNEQDQIDILRVSDVPAIDNMGKGCRILILSPPEEAGGHEVYDIQLADHGSLQSQPHARGTREQLIVLEGAVSIQSGTVSENLVQGDTARYPVDVPHSISSLDGPARVFLIVKNS